jgi:hypothetical protein
VSPDLISAIYDELLPHWQEASLVSGNRRIRCPLHADRSPSFDIHPEKLTWICRAGCGEGGGWDLAIALLGEADARDLLRRLDGHPKNHRSGDRDVRPAVGDKPPVEVEVLGPPAPKQVAALKRSRRLVNESTLEAVGAKCVRGFGQIWLGLPTLNSSWKLWAIDDQGKPWASPGWTTTAG